MMETEERRKDARLSGVSTRGRAGPEGWLSLEGREDAIDADAADTADLVDQDDGEGGLAGEGAPLS